MCRNTTRMKTHATRTIRWMQANVSEGDHRKDKGDGCRLKPNKHEQCDDRKYCEGFVYFGQHYSLKEKELKRRIMVGWAAYLKKPACHLAEETCVHLLCAASYDIYMVQTWTLTKQAQNNLQPHKPKWKEVCSAVCARTKMCPCSQYAFCNRPLNKKHTKFRSM